LSTIEFDVDRGQDPTIDERRTRYFSETIGTSPLGPTMSGGCR